MDGSQEAPTKTELPRYSPGSSDSVDEGRFPPGTLLAQRYRIVSLLGRGGMGEVYRANDLLLGQTVALKFLPARLTSDEAALNRFRGEVRIARQVSHPNVCRVYDIGEAEGLTYLSMEYVDGEDLGSLLRRIGHLPEDKAVDVARKLCAGLAAAHDKGVIHRDLKPANIMIDGQGHVRITDFGLAGISGQVADIRSGTPDYMAPEQLEGKEVTARSDIYSLGLVLAILFTGKQPRDAASPAAVDPAVDRVIKRCLEADPAERPATALAVAASLPGGDPLAAALAAGTTPTPGMVAQAGPAGGMPLPLAAVCLALVIGGLLVAAWFPRRDLVAAHVPFPEAPAMLASRAREYVRLTGYQSPVRDEAMGWEYNERYLNRLWRRKDVRERTEALKTLQPPAILFWYRQTSGIFHPLQRAEVTRTDPAFADWMIEASVDARGRLVQFYAYPSPIRRKDSPVPVDWTKLIVAAGFDPTQLMPVASPVFVAKTDSDAKAAWTGVYPDAPQEAVRVQAASFQGRPVMFRVLAQEDIPAAGAGGPDDTKRGQQRWLLFFIVILPALAAAVAWRNVSRGRGDIRGAARLAIFTFFLHLASNLLKANHVPSLVEAAILWKVLLHSVLSPVLFFVLYLALEPYIRRRMPDSLVSWSRLLMGKWRDPLVAADILVGLAGGFAVFLSRTFNPPTAVPRLVPLPVSAAEFAAARFQDIIWCIGGGLSYVFVFSVARFLLRRRWPAAAAAVLLVWLFQFGMIPMSNLPFVLAGASVATLVLGSRGLLAITAFVFAYAASTTVPFTLDFSLWYAGQSLLLMLMMTGIAVFAFWANLGGRTLWKEDGD